MNEILIGMNGRFFPSNWRPALVEIAFAQEYGFRTIQFPGIERGLDEEQLGAPIKTIAQALSQAQITPVMEIVVRVGPSGKTASGATPLDLVQVNLPAICGLPCQCVHWHIRPTERMDEAAIRQIEDGVVPQLEEAVSIATEHNVKFGIEHNEPDFHLFGSPETCHRILDAVPQAHLVWDLNHVTLEHLSGFIDLIPRTSMLHVSDTPLPKVNAHYPLGMGNIDFDSYARALIKGNFAGPAILEIGGTPFSGGFGRDTDEALLDSKRRFQQAIEGALGMLNPE
ncbi:MAG: sugar phosphate isomerase/epimerase family protein [Chloroflexota bacterium]